MPLNFVGKDLCVIADWNEAIKYMYNFCNCFCFILSTYKEMFGNTCRTLSSQHLLNKALFE